MEKGYGPPDYEKPGFADRKRATGLQELGILRQAGPCEQRSVHAAQAIFDNIAEIEQLAGEQGALYQDDRAERYEWCRLVAMVIEVYMGASERSLQDLQSNGKKSTSE